MQQIISLQPQVALAPKGHLLRVFGMVFAVSVVIGTTIGSGILRTPGEVAAHVPNAAWIIAVWIFGGVNALLGATAYAELGAMLPSAGGPYVFARRALGDYAGFFVGYVNWTQECAAEAAIALVVGEYSGTLLPALGGHVQTVAMAVFLALVALNWVQVRMGGWIQNATTVVKMLGLLGLVIAAFALPHAPAAPAAVPALPHGAGLLPALALAMQGVIYTYNGYHYPVYFGEELRDPGREIPRSIFRGLYLVIAIYLLLNAAFLWVVPMHDLAHDPFAGGSVARILFGVRGDQMITLIVVVSMIGTLNAGVLSAPRIVLEMGRDRLFPSRASHVSRGGVPDVALFATVLATLAFLFSGAFTAVLDVAVVLMVVQYILMFVSVFVLRRREPDMPRPYRTWCYPWTTIAGLLIAVAFLAGAAAADRVHSAIALAILIAGYPLYLGVARVRRGVA
jgi:APA family basic amino acid/polyamine antiporter